MATRRKQREPDVRLVFDQLSNDALLDDVQLGQLAGRSPMTIKRWRREKKTPPFVSLNGCPRLEGRRHPAMAAGDLKKAVRVGGRERREVQAVFPIALISRLRPLAPAPDA